MQKDLFEIINQDMMCTEKMMPNQKNNYGVSAKDKFSCSNDIIDVLNSK